MCFFVFLVEPWGAASLALLEFGQAWLSHDRKSIVCLSACGLYALSVPTVGSSSAKCGLIRCLGSHLNLLKVTDLSADSGFILWFEYLGQHWMIKQSGSIRWQLCVYPRTGVRRGNITYPRISFSSTSCQGFIRWLGLRVQSVLGYVLLGVWRLACYKH